MTSSAVGVRGNQNYLVFSIVQLWYFSLSVFFTVIKLKNCSALTVHMSGRTVSLMLAQKHSLNMFERQMSFNKWKRMFAFNVNVNHYG